MGYVWCDGYVWDMCGVRYVWDMCGVRYANNLLKNPATKRLSGKSQIHQKILKNDGWKMTTPFEMVPFPTDTFIFAGFINTTRFTQKPNRNSPGGGKNDITGLIEKSGVGTSEPFVCKTLISGGRPLEGDRRPP